MTKKVLIDDVDRYAVQALAAGTASSGQQIRALNFIINLSGLRDMPAVAENPHAQAFKEGRRFVGWHIAKLVELAGMTDATKG